MSFILEVFVDRMGLSDQRIGEVVVVSSTRGLVFSSRICSGCVVFLADEPFDVILGVDWLS